MKKIYAVVAFAALILFSFNSCKKDDAIDDNFIPARDRGPEAIVSTGIVERYLETHFYNYEEFENPPANFDFRIKFDTIAGDNADKTPLMEQVSSKTVKDRVTEGVEYTLYYLNVIEGEGNSPRFPDIGTISYEGRFINEEPGTVNVYSDVFDSSVVPVRFDLTQIVNGLQDALTEFSGATNIITNPDGTLSFENYGVGAVFMQSGLGYYVNPPPGSSIPIYSQLIFTFQLYEAEEGDQDDDGVPSFMEDRNGNGLEEDDDTDGDLVPNYLDADDDNDGRPTSEEIEIDEDGNITFPDSDGDGIPDYLDADS
ncbi:FKBP-type peptidyl-prolyl cis-trans isomerase [Constantimarinum furrinae]|uniref:Peptidylprolyl isomerase n=1 Tax=Constantimarinum furrinae TaxID=2562285 RepID=A0A7G8PQL6_9FLAO|nr:hypothetical protein [Constantimarinum furrinae]QNJ96632.1 hypothetical protein ALE3EI_0041 [Constantimarinum furrinae]